MRFGDAIAILLIVVLNAVLGYYQERRAEAALDALQKMQTPNARVRRDDKVQGHPRRRARRRATCSSSRPATPCPPTRGWCRRSTSRRRGERAHRRVAARRQGRARQRRRRRAARRSLDHALHRHRRSMRGKGRARRRRDRHGHRARQAQHAHPSSHEQSKTPLEEKLEHFGKRILWACLALSALLMFAWGMIRGDAARGTSSCSRP